MSFTANNTGGEYKHKLTIKEMPSHTHSVTLAHGSVDPCRGLSYASSIAGTFSDRVNNTGGGDFHNNIQPYIVTYMWKRTA